MATREPLIIKSVKLPAALNRSLTARAKRDDVPASHVIRCALRDYLKGQVTK